MGTKRQPRKHETVFQRNYRTLPLWGVKYCPTRNNVGYRLYQGLGLDTRKSFQGSHLNRRCPAVQWINSRRVKNCMLCVICISRGGSASVSFSEVEERSVDLRNVSTVPSQSEPTRYVGRLPNITGTFRVTIEEGSSATGSFYVDRTSGNGTEGSQGRDIYYGIDASLSSSIYGSSATTQPASMKVLPCIKF